MLDELAEVVSMRSCQDGEEVVACRLLALCKLIWQVHLELHVLLHHGPQPLHSQLVVVWHNNRLDLIFLQEALFTC